MATDLKTLEAERDRAVAAARELTTTLLGRAETFLRERDAARKELGLMNTCWRSEKARANEALFELKRLRELLGRVEAWTHEHGAALKPAGADTYGEGMRVAKGQVADLIRREGGTTDG